MLWQEEEAHGVACVCHLPIDVSQHLSRQLRGNKTPSGLMVSNRQSMGPGRTEKNSAQDGARQKDESSLLPPYPVWTPSLLDGAHTLRTAPPCFVHPLCKCQPQKCDLMTS